MSREMSKEQIKNRCQEAGGLQPKMLTLGLGLTLSQMLIIFFSLCRPLRENEGQRGVETERQKGSYIVENSEINGWQRM